MLPERARFDAELLLPRDVRLAIVEAHGRVPRSKRTAWITGADRTCAGAHGARARIDE
jgi:hypothetical protein